MDIKPINENELYRAKHALIFADWAFKHPNEAIENLGFTVLCQTYPCCHLFLHWGNFHAIGREHTAYRFGITPKRLTEIEMVLKVMQALEG